MNKHILLVMKWKNDNVSVTLQELIDNRDDAYGQCGYDAAAAAVTAAYYAYDAYYATAYAYVASTGANALATAIDDELKKPLA